MKPRAGADIESDFRFLAHETPRPGQIEMIYESREALRMNGFHIAAAPTGIGKTAASLAAALEISRDCTDNVHILFLTGRQSQHRIVIETVRQINSRIHSSESKIKVVDLIGRESMCDFIDMQTGKCDCEKGSSEGSKFARRDEMSDYILEQPRHVEQTIEKCKIWGLCAWSTCRYAAKDCDILVCDYNHVFSDNVRENSLPSMGIDLDNTIIVVDEAHNLPDRIRMNMERIITPTIVRNTAMELEEYLGHLENDYQRNMSSAVAKEMEMVEWTFEILKLVRSKVADLFSKLHSQLSYDKDETMVEIAQLTNVFHSACDEYEGISGQKKLGQNEAQIITKVKKDERIRKISEVLNRVKIEIDSDEEDAMEPDAYRLGHIMECLEKFSQTTALSLVFSNKGKEGKITSHLLDPGIVSGKLFSSARGAILMSGTLYPPQMYSDILNLPKDKTTKSEYKSPFASERRPVLVATDVSTKYNERSELMWNKIRSHIQALIDGSNGHIAVFCPSYKLLDEILEEVYFKGVKKVVESRDWSKNDIDKIVGMLRDERSKENRILLCGVFGARLSEGIDYSDGVLDAVVCIGIPNPPPSVLSSALKEYASDKFGKHNAWRYTVTQPAINSILQAMGRPIRSIKDRALILLLDKRNRDQNYARCYPVDMKMNATSNSETTTSFAKRFFKKIRPN
ncbi:MAG: ATP-dependent DNA helicase [Candidatus Poseidoniaceae archaeon]|nr:ATP-dependent DNA helicase [Candidatus Poseidoniaceae archaeon]